MRRWWPALLALVVGVIYAGARMAPAGFDPVALAEIGPRYAELEPDAEPGYDGQFTLFIALDPNPRTVASHLDVPAYRYQRILLPITARLLSFAQPGIIPWMLLFINLASLAIGTRLLTELVIERGFSPGYALVYGLWVGIIAPVGLDLHEPLAYALVILSFYLHGRGRSVPAALAAGLALFAKETTMPFWLVLLVVGTSRGRGKSRLLLALTGLAFLAWQVWLWMTFGSPGIGSGGEMATGFELIPYMGLWRIGLHGWRVLLLFAVILIPTIVVPSVWGIISTTRSFLHERTLHRDTLVMWLNSLLIVFAPHSTFREPLGIVRLADGMVLGLILYGTYRDKKRVLNYAFFWIAFLFLLIQQS